MRADSPRQAVRPVQLSRRVAVVDDDDVATVHPRAADASQSAAAGLISMRSPALRVMPLPQHPFGSTAAAPVRGPPPLPRIRRGPDDPALARPAVAPDQAVDGKASATSLAIIAVTGSRSAPGEISSLRTTSPIPASAKPASDCARRCGLVSTRRYWSAARHSGVSLESPAMTSQARAPIPDPYSRTTKGLDGPGVPALRNLPRQGDAEEEVSLGCGQEVARASRSAHRAA